MATSARRSGRNPDIDYVIADGPAPASWTALAGLAQGWRSVIDVCNDVSVALDECRDLDGERVLALTSFSGAHGKASGIEIGAARVVAAGLFHISSGQVTRIVNYYDRERAFADLGLTLEPGTVGQD